MTPTTSESGGRGEVNARSRNGSEIACSCWRRQSAQPARCSRTEVARRGSSRVSSPSARSEEHTSELQSRFELVCRLLLEKKKEAGSAGHLSTASAKSPIVRRLSGGVSPPS